MSKMKINFLLDVVLTIIYLIIMEPLLTGITLHEWIGLGVGVAFIIHILLHWKWVVEATKRIFSKFPTKAKLNYVLDFLLLIGSIFILLSSFAIAKTIDFSWVGLGGYSFTWFQIHVGASFLVLLVIAIHIGLHWQWTVSAFRKIFNYSKKISYSLKGLIIILIIGFGILSIIYIDLFAILDRSLSIINPDYSQYLGGKGGGHGAGGGGGGGGMGMHSLTTTTDSTSVIAYVGIVAFIALIAYYLDLIINKISRNNRKRLR